VSTAVSTSTWSCMKSNGVSFMITRAWKSYGGFDSNAKTNLANAKSAGIAYRDVYAFPCRGKSVSSQVSSLMSGLSGASYGMIWIDVETNPSSGCGWGTDYTSNCNYVASFASTLKSYGANVGIYSSQYMWETIMGSRGACSSLAKYDLWYAHYDNSASFSDFSRYGFGGWTRPAIKQYKGDTTLCSAGVDLNYY
jgi:GH25 family lysozyme M1 (1,4-beta-N-acetylmuramidase)